ncbi:hypothetical protein V2A60_006063 [Cordyceps javanica]
MTLLPSIQPRDSCFVIILLKLLEVLYTYLFTCDTSNDASVLASNSTSVSGMINDSGYVGKRKETRDSDHCVWRLRHPCPSRNCPDAQDVIDIVAIHGLNGHYEGTWTAQGGDGAPVNWLKDLLPKKIPNSRIMSFYYNSKMQSSKSTADVFTFADQLLEQLLAVRDDEREESRPILFICHSLGGIVFKQAVNRAFETKRYQQLSKHFAAVAFFGTPHRGSDIAQWGTMLGSILKIGSLGSTTNLQLTKDLEPKSRVLTQISDSFTGHGKSLTIFSFYETEKMNHANCLVVNKDSATLGWPDETRIGVDGNHRSICRFSSAEEPRFRPVWTNLKKWAVTLTQKQRRRNGQILSKLHTSNYEAHKDRNPRAVEGTCTWIFRHQTYQSWLKTPDSTLLWISADPGCGKSVLTSFLVDQHRREPRKYSNVCFFFFKADDSEQNDAKFGLSAILHQLYSSQSQLIEIARKRLHDNSNALNDLKILWDILKESTENSQARTTICLIDGLDECEEGSRKQLIELIFEYFSGAEEVGELPKGAGKKLKLLVTSRPVNSIKTNFDKLTSDLRRRGLGRIPLDLMKDIAEQVIAGADRTFLWTSLILELLKERAEEGASRRELEEILYSRDIDAIYTVLLDANKGQKKARKKKMLSVILAATRPLTIEEMSIALAINPAHDTFTESISPSRRTFDHVEYELVYPFENHIKSLCGNFIRVIRGKIYLVHQTAREFLLDEASIREYLPPKLSWLAEEDRIFPMDDVEEEEEEEEEEEADDDADDGDYEHSKSLIALAASPWQHSISLIDANALLLEICVTYLYMMGKQSKCTELGRPSRKTAAFLEYAGASWVDHFHVVSGEIPSSCMNYYHALCHPRFPAFNAWVDKVHYCAMAVQAASEISDDRLQDQIVEMLRLHPGGYRLMIEENRIFQANPTALRGHYFPQTVDGGGKIALDLATGRRGR